MTIIVARRYSIMTALIEDSKATANVSLAAFKPSAFRRFIVEDDDREWKEQRLEQLKQVDMFTGGSATSEKRAPIDKIPYKFKYRFEDDEGRSSKMTIEDWEIGALYRNCLAAAEGDEHVAIDRGKSAPAMSPSCRRNSRIRCKRPIRTGWSSQA